jgi:hypothetical protein
MSYKKSGIDIKTYEKEKRLKWLENVVRMKEVSISAKMAYGQ